MGEAADKSKVDWRGRTVHAKDTLTARGYVNKKPMRYVSLHHHSTFSYKDGYQLPSAHVRRAEQLNMAKLALTEHGNVSSHVKLEKACNESGVQPIYGCELYTGGVGEERTQRKNHLTVLAKDADGYQNLLRMVSQGWSDSYYEPTVSGETFGRCKSGIIALSGCTASLLSTSLIGGKNIDPADASYERGRDVARKFKRAMNGDYFLEVQMFPELENVCRLNVMMEQLSRELKIPLVATGDVHYTVPEENEIQQILHSIGRAQTLEDLARNWGYHVPLAPPINDNTVYRRLRATGLSHLAAQEAILNTEAIAQACDVTLPKLPRLRYPLPPGYASTLDLWKDWIKEGWRYRGHHRLPTTDRDLYRSQLLYEMGIIEEKDFVDYFLIVSDIVKFAKDSGIGVGPARGSAAASLVCFDLRITEVNPMLFPDMLFERFIDLSRADLPDIDLDFDSNRRREIWEYAVSKFGAECVANIGTFTYFKSKNSLDDIGMVYHIPQFRIDTVKELLLERSSGDLRASATIEDTVEMFDNAKAVFEEFPDLYKAMALEGNIKGMGIHAAGLVLANGPITDVCAIYSKVDPKTGEVKTDDYGNPLQVISLDKDDAERQGVLKVDILGLSTMSAIGCALEFLDMKLEDLYAIPLDDPEVIDGFQRNDVVGVFQFDGRAMRSVNAELKPDSFLEVAAVNALARPGPLHNNASAEFVDIKWGRKQPQMKHPLLEEITRHTHYQIVYQEQILRIVREIGDFDWTAASYIRKIISKKLGEQEFNRQWEKFWAGAQNKGMSEEDARAVWGQCITAGAYAFNMAHSVSYAMLAWWCMWLKVHHPVEFYCAWLREMPSGDKGVRHLEYLKDAEKHGIHAYPPDPVTADTRWTHDGVALYGGLEQVKGIGDKMSPLMVEFRRQREAEGRPVTCWADYKEMRGIGDGRITLFEEFGKTDDPYGVHWLRRHIDNVKEMIQRGELGPLPYPTHTSLEVPYTRGQDTEVVWLGVLQHRNLRDLFESNFARTGVALDPKDVKDPHLREWVIGIGADDDELITITWDRWRYPRFKRAIWSIKPNHDLVLLKGVKRGYQARRAVYVSQMWVIDPEE